jgi:hypothetical protein
MRRSRDGLAAAVALTLLSGVFMVWAGAALAAGDLNMALWVSLPPLVTIEVATWLVRRSDRRAGEAARTRRVWLRQEGLMLVAGALLLVAGYLGWAAYWLPSIPFVVAAGFVAAAGLVGRNLERKRRLVRAAEKYVANPPTLVALRLGLPMPLVLLETVGRISGQPRRNPVMNGLVGNELWIVAEHGTAAGYVRNLLANPHVRVKVGRTWPSLSRHRGPVLALIRPPRTLRPGQHSSQRMGKLLQEWRNPNRRRRLLARDLPDPCPALRSRLRQHAALRAGQGRSAPSAYRHNGQTEDRRRGRRSLTERDV